MLFFRHLVVGILVSANAVISEEDDFWDHDDRFDGPDFVPDLSFEAFFQKIDPDRNEAAQNSQGKPGLCKDNNCFAFLD